MKFNDFWFILNYISWSYKINISDLIALQFSFSQQHNFVHHQLWRWLCSYFPLILIPFCWDKVLKIIHLLGLYWIRNVIMFNKFIVFVTWIPICWQLLNILMNSIESFAFIHLNIAQWFKNPFGRTGEHNQRYNWLNI